MAATLLQTEDAASPELDRFAVLDDLARQAARMAGLILAEAEAIAADDAVSAAETVETLERLSRAHARVSRTARLCFLLRETLISGARDREKAAAGRTVEATARKRQIEHIVDRIAREGRDGAEPVYIGNKVRTRLDREDIYGDVLARPASELIALICKDLGLDPDWSKLVVEAWAKDEIESGVPWPPPGSPSPRMGEASRGRSPRDGGGGDVGSSDVGGSVPIRTVGGDPPAIAVGPRPPSWGRARIGDPAPLPEPPPVLPPHPDDPRYSRRRSGSWG